MHFRTEVLSYKTPFAPEHFGSIDSPFGRGATGENYPPVSKQTLVLKIKWESKVM